MQSISTSEAVQLIVRDTMRWINANKDSRPGWAVLNFSGLFLFHCQHIRRVPMFSRWSDQKFLKAKFLATDFNGKSMTFVQFTSPGRFHNYGNIQELNKELQRAISEPTYWEKEQWIPEVTVLPRVLTPRPQLGVFPSLENFSFTPKTETIRITI